MNVSNVNQTVTLQDLHILFVILHSANLIVNLPINTYTLCLMLRGPQEKIQSDFFSLNQNVCEILLSLTSLLYLLKFTSLDNVFDGLVNFFRTMCMIGRPLYQSFICLEHYLAVVHPVVFLKCKPLRYRVALCCISWLMMITVSTVSSVFDFPQEIYCFIAALYVFFLTLISFCCFILLWALKRPTPGNGKNKRGDGMKKRAFNIILFNLVYILLSQVPMAVAASLRSFMLNRTSFVFSAVAGSVFILTGFVPPLLYLYRVRRLSRNCSCC